MVVTTTLEHDLNLPGKTIGMLLFFLSASALAELHVVIIEGLGGEPRYAQQFAAQVTAIEAAAQSLGANDRIRVFRASEVSRERVLAHFADLQSQIAASDQFALYLIGHGSYDDHQYKFNVPGPDLTGEDLAEMLDGLNANSQLLVNTSSASGAIAETVANDNRMLILATRSGVERHATRFGNYFAAALSDPAADLDKNQVVSAAEAFDFAERQVDDYFERNGQLATEHARLEGERADRFSVARLGASRPVRDDLRLRELTSQRDELNSQVEALRLEQVNMTAADYRSQLLQAMVELARAEEAIEQRERELDVDN